ncbi:hypothetical protein GCM10023324_08980 [Streptomyces youssoufiensis]
MVSGLLLSARRYSNSPLAACALSVMAPNSSEAVVRTNADRAAPPTALRRPGAFETRFPPGDVRVLGLVEPCDMGQLPAWWEDLSEMPDRCAWVRCLIGGA